MLSDSLTFAPEGGLQMVGVKQFEPDRALDNAVRVFWSKGYEGASYGDLTRATGLNKSSLYNAFGDKRELYERCLARYAETYAAPLLAKLDEPSFVDAISGYFEGLLVRFSAPALPKGCLATFAAVELGGIGGGIGARIMSNLETTQAAFRSRCEKAVKDGELPRNTDCDSLSAMLLAVSRGLAAVNRGFGDVSCAVSAVKAVLQMLECPPRKNR